MILPNLHTMVVEYKDGYVALLSSEKRVIFAHSLDAIARMCSKIEKPSISGSNLQGCINTGTDVRRVSLILTKDCPLQCIYCYAFAGEMRTTLPKSIALRAIREVAIEKPEKLHVTFFGGEPTMYMDTIRACVELSRQLAPNCFFHVSTGGIVPEGALDYFITQGFTINLSMDGPHEIQNRLRPFPNGQPSADIVERVIRQLVAGGAIFKVRCTVMELNVRRLAECVEYWAQLGVRYIHFEPINIVGRASRSEMVLPDADVYVENFFAALDMADKYGVGLINSAYMNLLNPSPCYCTTVAGDKLMIAPDGAVTMCYEVQECGHPLSDFVIGRYDPESNEFVIDREKESRLHSITVESYEECKNCFAKYVCAGGCPNRNVLATSSLTKINPWICTVKKALIRNAIIRIYEASKDEKLVSPVAGDLNR